MSLNHDIADLFHSLSALMELKGENVFKVIAFQKVGRIIRDSSIDLKRAMEEGKLGEIEGIGKASQQIIEEYIRSGKSTVFNEIAESVPAGDVADAIHVAGMAGEMNWDDRLGSRRQRLLNPVGINGECPGETIDQDRLGPEIRHHFRCRRERHGGHDDLISLLQADGLQRQMERGGA